MSGSILSVTDLGAEGIAQLLARADEFRDTPELPSLDGTIGLVFLEPSLRSRLGFAAAAGRLGLRVLEVYEQRSGHTSPPESVADTLRVVSGYVDALVLRSDDVRGAANGLRDVPLLNAGDRSTQPEHPSQALVDLYAVRTMLDRPCRHLVVWGDPTMRAAWSLLAAVALTGAAEQVTIVSDEAYLSRFTAPAGLSVEIAGAADPLSDDADVLYVTGMPHASIDLDRREQLVVGTEVLNRSPAGLIVLSPMPVIDEISPEARRDERMRFFDQSDLAIWVRMAVLERLISAH